MIDHLFVVDDTTAPKITLADTDFREFYPTLSSNMAWKNVKVYVRQAMTLNILPIIKQSVIDQCAANLALAPNSRNAVISTLTDKIKQALATYAIHQGFTELNASISDGSVNTPNPDGATPLSQWNFRTQRWNTILKAELFLDDAIQYIVANAATFPTFETNKYSTAWFKTSTELTDVIQVNGWRAFMQLRKYMSTAEDELKAIIGCDVYTDLLTNKDVVAYAASIPYIKAIIANKALEMAIPKMLTWVEGNTVTFMSTADGVTDGYGVYSKPNLENIKLLLDSCRSDASRAIDGLISVMNGDTDTYSVFAEWLENRDETSFLTYTPDGFGGAVGGIMM